MNSTFLLGADMDAERELSEILAGDAARFLALAQRCVWGVTEPELVRVNVDKARRKLLKEFPQCMPAQLLDAWSLASLGRNEEADRSLASARALSESHPLAFLCPSEAEWAAEELPVASPMELVPDRLWRLETWFSGAHTRFLWRTIMTVVRCESGELLLHNPGLIDDERAAWLLQLGTVRWSLHPTSGHNKFIDSVAKRYPEAAHLGVTELLAKPGVGEHLTGTPDSTRLPEEFEVTTLKGTRLGDAQLYHRPTRTLMTTHLPRFDDLGQSSFQELIYAFAWGVYERYGWYSYHAVMWQKISDLQSGLRTILSHDIERQVGSHGDLAGASGAGIEGFRQSLEWAIELKAKEHKRLQRSYLRKQPGFLIDLIRYSLFGPRS